MSKIGHIAKGARPMIRDVCEAGCTYAAISTANVLYASRRSNSLEFQLDLCSDPGYGATRRCDGLCPRLGLHIIGDK